MKSNLVIAAGYNSMKMNKGFALISCLLTMSLLFVLSLGLIQLSSIESKRVNYLSAKQEAEANARLALEMAISQLQEFTGSDQIVTARADILSEDLAVENPNWVGAWKTTYQIDEAGIEWPIIGKQTDTGNTVYAHKGVYSDMRSTNVALNERKWRKQMLNGWLVSSPLKTIDPVNHLSLTDSSVVELLGKGALGKLTSTEEYERKSVKVKKISVGNSGSIAWWTADNNQKACIKPVEVNESEQVLSSGLGNDFSFIRHDDELLFTDFYKQTLKHKNKIISLASSNLAQEFPNEASELLKFYTHDFTDHAPGLLTNTVLGGFQRDLTPLLFSNREEKRISFPPPNSRVSDEIFHSDQPIITSSYHDVLAPTFSALRYWGLQKYSAKYAVDTKLEEYASRPRSNENWPYSQSDGVTIDARYWASEMPKIHPVMTDTRWHYYFSINGKDIRTHIIPRVCLWNPYNRDIAINEMVVLMPNPFYKTTGGFHFYVEDLEVDRIRSEMRDPNDSVHNWVKKSAPPLGDQYKARLANSKLFPQRRYLTFTLKATTLEAGECHVFSPCVSSQEDSANINLSSYDSDRVSNNILSSDSAQGEDHFYFDVVNTQFEIQTKSAWVPLSATSQDKMELSKIHDYRPETGVVIENFPFILKASNGTIPTYEALFESSDHPTLQLINNGTGGVAPTYYFAYTGSAWGSANTIGSFGSLQEFKESPYKDAPATHQVGAKLIWLDEATTEGNKAPLRYGTSSSTRWDSDHAVYHPSVIANWNVRAQLTSRSPAAQCGKKWYLFSAGPWILQFIPKSPQDSNDSPQLNDSATAFVKNPFGLSVKYASSPNVVLFDLPHFEHGTHSIGTLRHAMLSPYSWHPSYIVGHSLRDPHAPAKYSAHPEVIFSADSFINSENGNHWDYHIGGYRAGYSFGAANEVNDSDDLLQLGESSVSHIMDGNMLTSANDILPYDIAFEVNQNIWDDYFISSLSLNQDTSKFSSTIPRNQQCEIQYRNRVSLESLENQLIIEEKAAGNGFWLNGYYYRKTNAFNVNSTSIPAWTAFISRTIQHKRELRDGSLIDNQEAGFSRNRSPIQIAHSNRLDPEEEDAWSGLRSLTQDEVSRLAEAIVEEVKLRGPFISLADFVNRRLTDVNDEMSQMGTLDAAIYKSGINQAFYDDSIYATSTKDRGTDSDSIDNNQSLFKDSYFYNEDGERKTSQASIKTWGLPSFLMQSDILEPLAPSLAVRGDTFTIRAYGETRRGGEVIAVAYIEAIVERSPHYIDHQGLRDTKIDLTKNIPTDKSLTKDPFSGEITSGSLTEVNRKLGRRYQIKSFRWLSKNEI